ncbi:MAG: replication initiator protein A, partial [Pseudomonadota bacterium]
GAKIKRKRHDGRVTEWGLKLSEWLFKAIEANEVLTLHPDYFRLRKPIERRIYEIARKHCGSKEAWQIGLKKLQKKCGSSDAIRNFRLAVRALCDFDHLPDYSVSLEDDMVSFRSRASQPVISDLGFTTKLKPETFEAARQAAPGWDVYVIEQEWRGWVMSLLEQGMEPPRNPDSAFIGFCRKWAARQQ